MYLISIYFDAQTHQRIEQYIHQIAKHSKNTFMLDGHIPPHITISAFDTPVVEQVIEQLEGQMSKWQKGELQWASVGTFFPYVLYLAPVLNEYLHSLSCQIFDCLSTIDQISIRPYYRPFQWIPHTTIGKKLSKEEMRIAFEIMQNQFGLFSGEVTRIGLSKTNPYTEIWDMKLY